MFPFLPWLFWELDNSKVFLLGVYHHLKGACKCFLNMYVQNKVFINLIHVL